MIFLAAAVGLLAVLVWAGRQRAWGAEKLRLLRALAAAMAAVAAVVVGLRGGWIASLALVAASVWLGQSARSRRTSSTSTESMTDARARSMRGVGPDVAAKIERKRKFCSGNLLVDGFQLRKISLFEGLQVGIQNFRRAHLG